MLCFVPGFSVCRFGQKTVFTIKTFIFIVIVYYCAAVKVHIVNRTLHGSSKIWILCSRVKNNIDIVLATRT